MNHLAEAQRRRMKCATSGCTTTVDTGGAKAGHSEQRARMQLNPHPHMSNEWQQKQASLILQEMYNHEESI